MNLLLLQIFPAHHSWNIYGLFSDLSASSLERTASKFETD
jgi:hypothetical protein